MDYRHVSIRQKIITHVLVRNLTQKPKTQKKGDLNKLELCVNLLPWVVTGKHLGTRIENKPCNILN